MATDWNGANTAPVQAGVRAPASKHSLRTVALGVKDGAAWPSPAASLPNDGESLASWTTRVETLRAKGYNGNGAGMPLAVAVQATWPTPCAIDGTPMRSEQSPEAWAAQAAQRGVHKQFPLTIAAALEVAPGETPEHIAMALASGSTWSSPTVNLANNSTAPPSQHARNTPGTAVLAGATATHPLNPAWVEQLMGFPDSWTVVGPRPQEPRSTPGKRPARRRKRATGKSGSGPSGTP